MRVHLVLLAAALLALPSLASAKSVLSPGELSVGAEFFPDTVARAEAKVSPSAGFAVRYALSQDLAFLGTLGFFHRFRSGEDAPTFYAVGGAVQANAFSSKFASVFFRGGIQFIPRAGETSQELGVRFYAGPGVEARLTEAFSLQFYASVLDLQVGGASTDFDLSVLPAIGGYLYF